MRIFITKWFRRFARKQRIADDELVDAIDRAERGLIDADLGRSLIKQRVARPGQGARSGYRVFATYRAGELAFFTYGFPKKERDNISDDELEGLQEAGEVLLGLSKAKVATALEEGELFEIEVDDDEEVQE